MPKEFPNRIYGDGRLTIKPSFYNPVSRKEYPHYLKALTDIMGKANIVITIDSQDPLLPNTLLSLKQRFMIGFSNGCPWPEKVISEYLMEQTTPPTTLEELATQIEKSARSDGKHSFFFQILLQHASKPLKRELKSYHPWQQLKGQEDHNLPQEITDPNGKGAYGLACDPPYFDVLIPLYKYIDDDNNVETHQIRYCAVTDFLETIANKVKSINELVLQTKEFLTNPQEYLQSFLPTSK